MPGGRGRNLLKLPVHFVKLSLNSFVIHLSTVLGAWDTSKIKLENLIHYPFSQTASYGCCKTLEAIEGAQGPVGGDPPLSSRILRTMGAGDRVTVSLQT